MGGCALPEAVGLDVAVDDVVMVIVGVPAAAWVTEAELVAEAVDEGVPDTVGKVVGVTGVGVDVAVMDAVLE